MDNKKTFRLYGCRKWHYFIGDRTESGKEYVSDRSTPSGTSFLSWCRSNRTEITAVQAREIKKQNRKGGSNG